MDWKHVVAVAIPVLLLAAPLEPAGGQEPRPAPAKVRLTPRAGPGRTLYFVKTVEMSAGLDVPPGEKASPFSGRTVKTVTEMSMEVGEVQPKDEFLVNLGFGLQTVTLTDTGMKPLTYRSDAPLPKDPRLASSGATHVAYAGTEFTATLNARGVIADIHGDVEKILESKAKTLRLDEVSASMLEAAFTETAISAEFNSAFLATPLPENEVAAGASWKDEDALADPVYDEVVISRNLKLSRLDAAEARIEGTGTVSIRPAPESKGTQIEELLKKIKVKKSKAKALVVLSLADGQPLSVLSEAEMTTIEEGQPVAVAWSWKCSLNRVAAWPSRAK